MIVRSEQIVICATEDDKPTNSSAGILCFCLDTQKLYKLVSNTWTEVISGGGGAVNSVNAKTGIVVINPDDLDDASSTHKFTNSSDVSKLAGIASGAEVNVNPDWDASSGDAQILNKPTVQKLGLVTLSNDTLAQALATNINTKLTVTANRTLTSTVPPAGTRCSVLILTSGTSSYTVTFGTGFKPTATLATGTSSGKIFVINFISDGTNLYEAGRTAAMTA
jgi:hypothetical protein